MDLVVPVKRLPIAKSRLRGATADDAAHARLVLALAHDTVAAVRAAGRVRRLLVVSSDAVVSAELTAIGVEVVPDGPEPGLNRAYRHGAAVLRERDPGAAVGALQADLPALRSAELDDAIAVAQRRFVAGAGRAFCADTEGTGTTLLLAAGGVALDPLFGMDSAARHEGSGAYRLVGDWPGLRRDVDTADDLRAAQQIGLGAHTRAARTPSGCDDSDAPVQSGSDAAAASNAPLGTTRSTAYSGSPFAPPPGTRKWQTR